MTASMITKCFNPSCQASFDYRAGRLVRFSRKDSNHDGHGTRTFIEHFWLCAGCAELYKFESKAGMPVELIRDEKFSPKESPAYMVTMA
jgi:hypothetical protein